MSSPPRKVARTAPEHESAGHVVEEDGDESGTVGIGAYLSQQAADNMDTVTLTESIRENVTEQGFTFHAYRAGRYPLPNDPDEQLREDRLGEAITSIFGGRLLLAPVQAKLRQGASVLDLGTGTGKWCTELGDMFPNSTFLGLDLSPIQPDDVPPNVQFVVDDFEHEQGWVDPDETFDIVHFRRAFFSARDSKRLLSEIFAHLRPGGYIELQEFEYRPYCDDDTMRNAGVYRFRDYCEIVAEGFLNLGCDINKILTVRRDLEAANFVDVEHRKFKLPVGTWPKSPQMKACGDIMAQTTHNSLLAISTRSFIKGLQWTQVQLEIFLMEVRKALMRQDIHVYMYFHVVYARKPEEAVPQAQGV